MVDIKKLKPFGVVLILVCSVLALIVCFTGDMGVPERVTPEHTAEYYRQSPEHLEELSSELREKLFSQIDGDIACRVDGEGMVLVISGDNTTVKKVKAAAERDFAPELFSFEVIKK